MKTDPNLIEITTYELECLENISVALSKIPEAADLARDLQGWIDFVKERIPRCVPPLTIKVDMSRADLYDPASIREILIQELQK